MILCANKVDLVHLRKISEEQGRELAAKFKVGQSNAILNIKTVSTTILYIK